MWSIFEFAILFAAVLTPRQSAPSSAFNHFCIALEIKWGAPLSSDLGAFGVNDPLARETIWQFLLSA